MEIQRIPAAQLIPADYNPRKDLRPGDPEYEKLKRSLDEFGYIEPVIWNKTTGHVVGGHQRLKVLLAAGMTEIDCVVVELSPDREKALNVALNKISGDWDKDKLTDLITELTGADFDVSLTGFEPAELNELLSREKDAKEDDFDVDAALQKPAFVEQGDLWLLGKHRLVCGDSTKTDTVRFLMDGKKANLLLTDAPYNVDYTGGTGLKIANDKMGKQQFYEFLLAAFSNAYESLADGASAYLFHSDSEKVNFYNAAVHASFRYASTCIWVKNALVLGRGDFQQKHEPILYVFKDTAKHKFYGDRKQTTVWEFDRPTKSPLHPTMKPIPLTAYPMRLSSEENGIVLDLFGGSGTTLIAAEQLNRVCFMMEFDPQYASAIVRRFAAAKGGTQDISFVRNGKTYSCGEVYTASQDDLEYRDISVDAGQHGAERSDE